MYRVSNFIPRFALSLLAGGALAMIWANLSPQGYADFVEHRIADHALIGYPNPDATMPFDHVLTLGYLTGDTLMALFFLYLGKELWEALVLKNGALHGAKAIGPLIVALVAAAVPGLIYAALSGFVDDPALPAAFAGWPVVLAGDAALSYLIARSVLGPGHPALRVLLLVSIADDIIGLLLSGLAFPVGAFRPAWLLLPLGAALAVWLLFNWLPRKGDGADPLNPVSSGIRARLGLWPYAIAGVLSWYGTAEAGLLPALGLLPIIPAMPHADRTFGAFAEAESMLHDLLNRAAQLLVLPVTAILFLFALSHAGAPLSAADSLTGVVAVSLLLGKPLGFLLGGWLASTLLRRPLPAGIGARELAAIGAAAAAGLAVPLFALRTTLPAGALQDGARLGLVFSLLLAPLAAQGLCRLKGRAPAR